MSRNYIEEQMPINFYRGLYNCWKEYAFDLEWLYANKELEGSVLWRQRVTSYQTRLYTLRQFGEVPSNVLIGERKTSDAAP